MTRRALYFPLLGLAALGLLGLAVLSRTSSRKPEIDVVPIQQLRAEGRYVEALDAARRLEITLLADSKSPAWQREDAARLVETCTRAAAWPESARIALAEADRVDSEFHTLMVHGHYRRAFALTTQQLETRRRLLGEEHAETATSLANLAEVTFWRGDKAGASELHERALELRLQILGERHPQVAESQAALGRVEKGFRHFERAKALHLAAITCRRELFGEESLEVAASLFDLSDVDRAVGDFAAALELLDQGLRIRRKFHRQNDPEVARGMCNIGLIHLAQNRWKEAEPYIRTAAEADSRDLDTHVESRALSVSLLAAVLMKRGDLAQAEPYILASIRIHEALRREGLPGYPPGHPLTEWWRLAMCQLEQGKEREAWASVERGLNRNLLDGLFPPDSSVAPESPEWNASEETRFCTLAEVQAHLPSDVAIVGWLEGSRNTTGKVDYPFWGYVIRSVGAISWVTIAALPGVSDGAQSSILGRYGGAFRVGSDWPLRAPASPEFLQLARSAYAERIAPLLPHLDGVRRLFFVKGGSFGAAPLEALVDSTGVFLGDRFVVSFIPSATLFVRMREWAHPKRSAEQWQALLVGDSQGAADEVTVRSLDRSPRDETDRRLPALPGARDEIRQIAALFPSATATSITSDGATELHRLALSDSLRRFDLIHIATHVVTTPDGPMRAALAFTSGALRDDQAGDSTHTKSHQRGRVLAEDILSSWHLNADLVTLSACRGNPSGGVSTDPTSGICQALFLAGARSVLASFWTVDDAATALLMRRFYENLTGAYRDERSGRVGEPMFKPLALQEAKRFVREYREVDGTRPFENPVYWAAFELVGDPGDLDPADGMRARVRGY